MAAHLSRKSDLKLLTKMYSFHFLFWKLCILISMHNGLRKNRDTHG